MQRDQTKDLLAKHISFLTEALSRDACEGALIWRINALSCLCRVYALLAEPTDSASIATAARTLQRTGRLNQLVQHSVIRNESLKASVRDNSSMTNPMNVVKSSDASSYASSSSAATSILSLCCHLVGVPEGYTAVCDAFRFEGKDIYQHLSDLFASAGPPPISAPGSSMRMPLKGDSDSAFEQWCAQVRPVLTLMRALASSSPSSVRAMNTCAHFLHANYAAISKIMAMRWNIVNVVAMSQPASSVYDRGPYSVGSDDEQIGGSVISRTSTSARVHLSIISDITSLLKVVSASMASQSLPKELLLRGTSSSTLEVKAGSGDRSVGSNGYALAPLLPLP